jgi:Flp pilus assembly protein TadG
MKRPRSQAGNAMLEFAIGAGVMVAIFTGTFQFGYNFYRYNTLATAVSNGARYASLRHYDLASSGDLSRSALSSWSQQLPRCLCGSIARRRNTAQCKGLCLRNM